MEWYVPSPPHATPYHPLSGEWPRGQFPERFTPMPTGLHITHTHAPSHPGFWYPCDKKQIKDVLSSHLTYWGREQVKVDGDDVTREVPIAAVVATFCRGLTDEDGSAAPDRPEPIDVYATLGLARPESGRAAT